MENINLTDFGFVITDDECVFESVHTSDEAFVEYEINVSKSPTNTKYIIGDVTQDSQTNQHDFSLDQIHQPVIDLDDFFPLENVYGDQNPDNLGPRVAIEQSHKTEYDNALVQSAIHLEDFFCSESGNDPIAYGTPSLLFRCELEFIEHFLVGSGLNCEIIADHVDEMDTNDVGPNELVRAVKIKEIGKRERARRQREKGASYLGYSHRASKIKQNAVRPARKQGPACASQFCAKSSRRQCNLFPKSERLELFNKFWMMKWSQKQMYICQLIEPTTIKQRKADESLSRRHNSKRYFLSTAKGERLQVCLKMFLSTFGLNEKMVRSWLNGKGEFGLRENPLFIRKRTNKLRQQSAASQVLLDRKIRLLTFLIDYPKLESHYCRKDTEREYFETTHQTLTDLYKQYTEVCKAEKSRPLSFPVFSGTLKNLNFSLFKPRKDQCDECIAYKAGNSTIHSYEVHREKVDRASKEKDSDVKAARMKLIILLCMDVEGVVLCPKCEASALYFKSKLQLHNFTLYDILTHDSTNYVWDETEGDLQSSTFTSIVIHHLEQLVKASSLPIIIYSDGCTYQNRNVVIANALRLFAMKHARTITQKFLEVGHTHMECDSTHASIDRKTKNMALSVPRDFEEAISIARDEPFPFVVQHLTHEFFRNYDDAEYLTLKSIRPGKLKGDPKVTDIRSLQYTPNGNILYKLQFDDEYQLLPQKISQQSTPETKPLHESRLPIKYAKWKHLQELKMVLEPIHHAFYDEIPHLEEKDKKLTHSEKLESIMEKIKHVKRAPKVNKKK